MPCYPNSQNYKSLVARNLKLRPRIREIGILILAIVVFGLLANQSNAAELTKAPRSDGNSTANLNATKIRAEYQRDSDDLSIILGSKMAKPASCYQIAISNYLDEKWNSISSSSGCDSNTALCDNSADAKKQLLLQQASMDVEDKQTAIRLMNTWHTASDMYQLEHQLSYQLDPKNDADSFLESRQRNLHAQEILKDAKASSSKDLEAALNEFNSFINTCDGRKPSDWSVIGSPFPRQELTTSAIKLSIQHALLAALSAQKLPPEDRGYVGCLWSLSEARRKKNNCVANDCDMSPVDTKENLMSQLDDLKTHHCSAAYASQLMSESH